MSTKKTNRGAEGKPAQPPTAPEPKGRQTKDRSLEKEAGEQIDWEKAGEPKFTPQPKQ